MKKLFQFFLEAADYFRRHQAAALSNCLNTLAIVQDHLGKHQHALNTANEVLGLETPAARAMGSSIGLGI